MRAWEFTSLDQCVSYYQDQMQDGWCNATWDKILCWPPSPPDTVGRLPCPPLKGVDPSQVAQRKCTSAGHWEGRTLAEGLAGGWTNYTPCLIPEIRILMDKLYAKSKEDAQLKLQVAEVSRVIETVGLSLSLASILVSLAIFSYFRSLRNNRTKMHFNLFVAMVIQLMVRLTLYIDQYITRKTQQRTTGIDNTPVLCEGVYVLMEYARTAMFLWMFLEGHYLNSMLTVAVFTDHPNYMVYNLLGWGLPVVMTAVWAAVTAVQHTGTECWWGYNLSPYFWILEGPRLTVIITNFLFLLNILRVLITKLQASVSSETQQAKKAVRAAIVLLPLLGITNSLQMVHSPLEGNIVEFAAWSFVTTFLTAFQGFFVALLYCFLNQEVRNAIAKSLANLSTQRLLPKRSKRVLVNGNVASETVVVPEEPLTVIRQQVVTETTTEEGASAGGREAVKGEMTTTV
ncbi:PDF receptor-like [Portunus trituberculatus]|uniref:PDF receptor-like n=1 Tax=Portunus trituberculatus TaxID=210409 RepID=UPI001E1CD762|nr:PDF receptor-like [Portunus trituberculatus]